jgi:hypothetical protein
MGGSGSQNATIKSLKNNRNALRSKRKGFKHDYPSTFLKPKKLKFKELDPKTLKRLKLQIRRTQKSRLIKQQLLFLGIVMTSCVLFWIFL